MRLGLILTLLFASSLGGAYAENQNRQEKVLLIGDSISIGYTPYVKEQLPCVGRTGRSTANDRDTWFILENLDKWLKGHNYSIIYFNAGLWDISRRLNESNDRWALDPTGAAAPYTSPDDYRKNLIKIVDRLQKTGATIIFATTTDVPNGALGRKNEDVVKYNQIAKDVMASKGIAVDDLYDWMVNYSKLHILDKGDSKVHYQQKGNKRLAEEVIKTLKNHNACSQ